jgi:hypothetical protein
MTTATRVTAEQKRIAENLEAAKYQSLGNVVQNALVEAFGFESYPEKWASCLKSPRFRTLLAFASHGNAQWDRLVRAAAKVANNPKTNANFK